MSAGKDGMHMEWPLHGGQPDRIRQLFRMPAEQKLLDFSANINPLGPPDSVRRLWPALLEQMTVYPDPDYNEAVAAVAAHSGTSPDRVLLTNGGAEAIFLAARLLAGGTALIVHPTFAEYEHACAHYRVRTQLLIAEPDQPFPVEEVMRRFSAVDGLFLCRPNNPSGELLPRDCIVRLLEHAQRTETLLIVDEAFIDFVAEPDASIVSLLDDFPNLVLTRSLTKMYALPGLRIGYSLAEPHLIQQMAAHRMPWSVNGPAALLTPVLLEDAKFASRTRKWLQTELEWLRSRMRQLNFAMSASKTNFYLLRDPNPSSDAATLYAFLLEGGILPRHTHTFPGLEGAALRFAVRSREENERLLERLAEWRLLRHAAEGIR
ncbi:threonine-phosphate decarboxylase CobD [Xylanibacillus composti]|uniref:threonine-phosphate decarboxylase n=1 Tax=Xylanibacillus composti TaxID=1572762 RepID=A0A8J4H2F5_9BACL|nr:threonine-phosphate decarboxylase CobD [Xylanibacillus composti]GIQ67734.1 hypothetical protein XYCOK13_05580 [Xylanibacillus composti]